MLAGSKVPLWGKKPGKILVWLLETCTAGRGCHCLVDQRAGLSQPVLYSAGTTSGKGSGSEHSYV